MNRWTLPSAVATVLAVPAILIGWNATSWAGAVVRPWTVPEAAANAPGLHSGAQGPAPSRGAGAITPAVELPRASAPASSVTRVMVVKTTTGPTPEPQEDTVTHPDDVRGTDSGPEPHPDASEVPVTDPTLGPQTPTGQPIPADPGYLDEDGIRYFYDGSSGNIPPEPAPSPSNPSLP